MKKTFGLVLFLFLSISHATLYTPGTGGGSAAVNSVNGLTGDVVLDATSVNAVKKGGDTDGAAISLGTKDAYSLILKTSDTPRAYLATGGAFTLGGDTSAFTSTPNTFGTYKFQTNDDSNSFNVFDNFFSYYGSSSSDKYGTLFRMSLRPGDPSFTYSGDYNALRADGYLSQPGRINTWSALKTALSTTDGQAVLDNGIASEALITEAAGIIKSATGFKATQVQAMGTDAGTAHVAYGSYIDAITASGSDTANTAYGLYLSNNISASGTSSKSYAIKSDSTADSKFAGLVEVASLKINQTATAAAAEASTHKFPININGTTYYVLMTTNP